MGFWIRVVSSSSISTSTVSSTTTVLAGKKFGTFSFSLTLSLTCWISCCLTSMLRARCSLRIRSDFRLGRLALFRKGSFLARRLSMTGNLSRHLDLDLNTPNSEGAQVKYSAELLFGEVSSPSSLQLETPTVTLNDTDYSNSLLYVWAWPL